MSDERAGTKESGVGARSAAEIPHTGFGDCGCGDCWPADPIGCSDAASVRQSIRPTYDHRETGDRFTVETRINGRRLNEVTTRDPFIHHRIVIGWRDLLRFALGGREVVVVVGGDAGIVDDVIELDADALTYNSTRRDEWNRQVEEALRRV